MKNKRFRESMLLVSLIVLIILSINVFAIPQGPSRLGISSSGSYLNESGTFPVQAQAGNVTALKVNFTRSTEAWQGYYGNVTGTITLDDASNFTLYDWALPSPTGEIYASNGSGVTWSNVYCMNLSHKRNNSGIEGETGSATTFYKINMSQIELNYDINVSDLDGLNETFNNTFTDATGFTVGAITIDVDDGCSLARPYVNELYVDTWTELLLTDNESLVFTSVLLDNGNSYQPGAGDTADFEMLVLENGHTAAGANGQISTYYFYVELA